VGANKIIIKAPKKFRTTQPRAALGKNLDFFGYQEKPKILYSVMYACRSKLIAKTVLTHSPLPDHLCIS